MLDLSLNLNLGATSTANIVDPTALSDGVLTALGFTYTRTGELHDLYTSPAAPGNYRRRTANQPVYYPETVESRTYPALRVAGAATPLVSYSADATNAVWTKTSCVAEEVFGSLESDYLAGQPRRNLLFNSEHLTLSPWLELFVDTTEVGEGTSVESTAAGDAFVRQTLRNTVPDNAVMAATVVVKDDGAGWCMIVQYAKTGGARRLWVNLSTGETGTVNAAYSMAEVEDLGDGFFEIRTKLDVGNSVSNIRPSLAVGPAPADNTQSDEAGLSIIVRNVQLEFTDHTDYQVVGDGLREFHSLLTATAANALLSRTVTRASAVRQARARIKAPDSNGGSVFVSHGAPTGDELTTNGEFTSDITGWGDLGGWEDGSAVWNSGSISVTVSGYEGAAQQLTDMVPGRAYRITAAISAVGSGKLGRLYVGNPGSPSSATVLNANSLGVGTHSFVFVATLSNHSIGLSSSSGDGVIDWSSVSLKLVEEHELLPGEYVDLELTEYTGANPFFAVRIEDDEDTAELYDMQGFELSSNTIPPRTVPQGATPAAVGTANNVKTLGVSPAEVDFDILVNFRNNADNQYLLQLYNDADNYWLFYQTTLNESGVVNNRISGVNDTDTTAAFFTEGMALLGVSHVGTELEWRKDGTVEETDTVAAIVTGLTQLILGLGNSAAHFGVPIVAFRDNNGQLLQQIESYGPELVTNGPFDSDTGFAKGTGWTIEDGAAQYDGTGGTSSIAQASVDIEEGEVYEVSLDVLSNEGVGANTVYLTQTKAVSGAHLSVGHHVFYGRADAGTPTVYVYGRANEEFSFTNWSVRKVNFRQGVGFNLRAIEQYEASL